MGTRVRLKFHSDGFLALLLSDEVDDDLLERVKRIADAAGDGFEYDTYYSYYQNGRMIGVVEAATEDAKQAEAENKILFTVIGEGR